MDATNHGKRLGRIAGARTCYDHLAGRLGVALFDALVARGVILDAVAPGPVELGPAGPELLEGMGIDLGALRRQRRRFAAACLDWTERRPHLAGAQGAALCRCFLEREWVVRQPGTRAVAVTEAGRQGLWEWLGLRSEKSFP